MKPRKALLAVSVLLFLSSAAGFGFVKMDNSRTVVYGERAEFKMYLKGDVQDIAVSKVSKPADWEVVADTSSIDGDNYRLIETEKGYQKIYPVYINVKPSTESSPGSYTVETVFSDTSGDTGSGMSLRQVQPFEFDVDLVRYKDSREEDEDTGSDGGSGTESGNGGEGGLGGVLEKAGKTLENVGEDVKYTLDEEIGKDEDSGDKDADSGVNNSEKEDTEKENTDEGEGSNPLTGLFSSETATKNTLLLMTNLLLWGSVAVFMFKRRWPM